MPIYMAARGEQALALCGKIADGLMISNMCPPDFTRRAVASVAAAARAAGRAPPADVVQYVPCTVARDRAAALRAAKAVVGEMLPGFWSLGERVPAAKAALLAASALTAEDFAAVVARLGAGADPAQALDERFVAAFAIAGTADDCLAQARRYRAAGASEIVLTFAGEHPEAEMEMIAAAMRAA